MEGAAYRIESAEAGFGVQGVFMRVEAPGLIACTWIWSSGEAGEDPQDTVEVSFEPEGNDKTVVTVRHSSVAHIEGGGAWEGWNAVMDRLAALS